MDIQLVLIIILALLTINILIVGIYVVLVLKDLRTTISKTNNVLENVNSVTSSASHLTQALTNPITTIAGFATSVANSINAARSIRSLIHTPNDKDEEETY